MRMMKLFGTSAIVVFLGTPSVSAHDASSPVLARCAAMATDPARLACYDKVARQIDNQETGTTARSNPGGKWKIETKQSQIDDSTNVYVTLKAEQDFQGRYQTYRPQLTLRCHENKTEAFIVTGMAPNVEYGLHNKATATLRFDKAKAAKRTMSKSTDRKALFFPRSIKIIKRMLKHDTMLFQFTPFSANPTTTTFDLNGLASAIKPLRKHCGW